MDDRQIGLGCRILTEVEAALRILAGPADARRPAPAAGGGESPSERDRQSSVRLMRVNHAGEIAAQALYRGQALVARNTALHDRLLAAADEESDHLAWCATRLGALDGHTSLLAPAWYAGGFAAGLLAGLAGDRASLGFLAETERQVAEHLEDHLDRLPRGDHASRQIVTAMREDEMRHGEQAMRQGGVPLPAPVPGLMKLAARVMTTLSRHI